MNVVELLEEPEYGNWVSKRLIILSSILGLGFLGLVLLSKIFAIPAGLFFLVSSYFTYARYKFSPKGGNVQGRILDLLLTHLDWNGEGLILDVGCGNGALAIKLAHKYAIARVIGIDYWGGNWEYSKEACESNAKIEGVADRTTFQKASASALPFEDEHFDAVVSNLVFHEVKDVADKREAIREALRVLKKGGKFAFQDLFLVKRTYGDPDDLVSTVLGWKIRSVEFIHTRDATFIPLALKLPFMVGTIGVIKGEK